MKTALFVVDHRQEAGRGHIVRCASLADELHSRGWDTIFDDTRIHLPDHDVMIVDDYSVTREWLMSAAACSPFVVVVDDYQTERIPDGVGIVVNGSASGKDVAYAPSIRALRGPKYALLRREFNPRHFHPFRRRGIIDVTSLRGLTAWQVAQLMGHSMWVLSYGGMSALEAVATGTPVLLTQSPIGGTASEDANREALIAAGCALARGEDTDGADWDEMHKACLALTDGLGCVRVADAIEEYIA